MLTLQQLSVFLEHKPILEDITLSVRPGEWHSLVGPNGSGKSSLLSALMGNPLYTTTGCVTLNHENLLEKSVEQRARSGIFLAFQQPIAMPGIKIITFFHRAYCILTRTEMGVQDFRTRLHDVLHQVGLDNALADRFLHEGFSGGERKRLELAQLLLFPVELALLDELDSGLDVQGTRLIIELLHTLRELRPSMKVIFVSHSMRMIEQLQPTHIHTLNNHRIAQVDLTEIRSCRL